MTEFQVRTDLALEARERFEEDVEIRGVEVEEAYDEQRDIRVTVPENLDYSDLFTDLFEIHTRACQLMQVKTVNMGSLFSLQYRVRLKDPKTEKQLLDAMRCRNGNLEISCGLPAVRKQEDVL